MKKLLRLDSSIRIKGSHSRALADFFVTIWKGKYPDGEVIYRDLNELQAPHLNNNLVRTFHTPILAYSDEDREAIALSDELIDELKSADHFLLSSPLYNLNLPSTLKAYFDHIIRAGQTFEVNDGNYMGLIKNEASFIITSKGEAYEGTPLESLDFQTPYLKTIFGFIGLDLKASFSLEATSHPGQLERNMKAQTENIIKELSKL